eukprot:scpid59698/ scgid0374/ 
MTRLCARAVCEQDLFSGFHENTAGEPGQFGRMPIGSQNVAAGNTGTSMAVNIDTNGASGGEENVSRSMPVDLLLSVTSKVTRGHELHPFTCRDTCTCLQVFTCQAYRNHHAAILCPNVRLSVGKGQAFRGQTSGIPRPNVRHSVSKQQACRGKIAGILWPNSSHSMDKQQPLHAETRTTSNCHCVQPLAEIVVPKLLAMRQL